MLRAKRDKSNYPKILQMRDEKSLIREIVAFASLLFLTVSHIFVQALKHYKSLFFY